MKSVARPSKDGCLLPFGVLSLDIHSILSSNVFLLLLPISLHLLKDLPRFPLPFGILPLTCQIISSSDMLFF